MELLQAPDPQRLLGYSFNAIHGGLSRGQSRNQGNPQPGRFLPDTLPIRKRG